MKEHKLSIIINKPASFVFNFTINPKNTSKWIDSVEIEESSEWPIKLGTKYRNRGKVGKWNNYVVTVLEPSKLFELVSSDGNYHVRYTYTPIDERSSRMEYYEWVDHGELTDPFMQDVLEKLKSVIEI